MLMSSLPRDKACLHLYSEKASELYSVLENLGAEMLEGSTPRAKLETNQGRRQRGGCGAQSLRKGSWQRRGTVEPTDRGNTVQPLHVRAGHLHPQSVLVLPQGRETWSQAGTVLFRGM